MSYDLKIDDGDIVVDTQGDIIVVEGYDKLYQDLIRLSYISRGENKFDVDEGLGIYDLLGTVVPRDLTEAILGKEIYFGIQYMIEQQNAQAIIQTLSPEEQVSSVDGIVIQILTIKQIAFDLLLTTVKGLQVAFAFNVS